MSGTLYFPDNSRFESLNFEEGGFWYDGPGDAPKVWLEGGLGLDLGVGIFGKHPHSRWPPTLPPPCVVVSRPTQPVLLESAAPVPLWGRLRKELLEGLGVLARGEVLSSTQHETVEDDALMELALTLLLREREREHGYELHGDVAKKSTASSAPSSSTKRLKTAPSAATNSLETNTDRAIKNKDRSNVAVCTLSLPPLEPHGVLRSPTSTSTSTSPLPPPSSSPSSPFPDLSKWLPKELVLGKKDVTTEVAVVYWRCGEQATLWRTGLSNDSTICPWSRSSFALAAEVVSSNARAEAAAFSTLFASQVLSKLQVDAPKIVFVVTESPRECPPEVEVERNAWFASELSKLRAREDALVVVGAYVRANGECASAVAFCKEVAGLMGPFPSALPS